MKTCPYCNEEIQDEAIVCRYCDSELPEFKEKVDPQPEKAEKSKIARFGSCLFKTWLSLISIISAFISLPMLIFIVAGFIEAKAPATFIIIIFLVIFSFLIGGTVGAWWAYLRKRRVISFILSIFPVFIPFVNFWLILGMAESRII